MGERWISVAASSTSSSSITLRSVCDVWDWREFTVHLPSPSDLECRVALERLLRHSNAVSMTAARMHVISPPLYTPHMPYTRSRSLFWIPLQFAVSLKIIDTCRSSLWWKHLHEFSTGKYWQLPIFERRGAISVPVKSAPAKQRNAAATVKIIDETIRNLHLGLHINIRWNPTNPSNAPVT